MKEPKLIERVVLEIKSEMGEDGLSLHHLADELRCIADEIEDGMSAGDETECGREYLWEHECPRYGGFRMGDKSLICQDYYHSEPKPNILPDGEHVVATINKQDLIDCGYDVSDLSDDDMQSIASRMGKAYHEGYCECWIEDLRSAADHYDVPRLDEDIEDPRLTPSQAKELGY